MKKLVFNLIILLLAVVANAQVGTIAGNIKDEATGESLIGATVVVKGTTLGAATDFDGNYTIKGVKAGTYVVEVSYISYATKSIDKVQVIANQTTKLNTALTSDDKVLNQVEVVATRRTGTEMSVITELKKADQIAVGVSAAQIAKTQDRDAGQILRRVPGVSIVDNRYVVVRGLVDRYNTVMLNDIITPSLEVDKKAFSFDLIPAAMIDRMLVFKSGGADLPAEFAGGVIKIYTKSIPDENFVSVSLQGGYREQATFTKQLFNRQEGPSALGFSRSSDLPSVFPKKNVGASSDINIAKSLNNDWGVKATPIIPDVRFGLAAGKKFNIGKVEAGNLTTLNYSNTWISQDQTRIRYQGWDEINQKSSHVFDYQDRFTANTVNLGLISNFNFRLGSKMSLDFRNLLNQTGKTETTYRVGSTNEGSNWIRYAYRYEQRTLYSSQLAVTYNPGDRDEFKLTGGMGITARTEPDLRKTGLVQNQEEMGPFKVYIPGQAASDFGRFFSRLRENNFTGAGSWEHKMGEIKDGDQFQDKIKAGFYADVKERIFAARWMSYIKDPFHPFDNSLESLPVDQIFSPENIRPGGFVLDERTNKSDKYSAASSLLAGYVSYSKSLGKLNMIAGVRAENSILKLNSYESTKRVNVNYPKLSVVPSLNLTYNLTEKQLVRFAYTYSVNRPEFRELAPFSFYDFNFDLNIKGNPDLKIAAINNYDLRWEFYPSATELITVGVFYKQFKNPIERLIHSGGGNFIEYNFENADVAVNKGAEIEIRKNLSVISDNKFFNRLSLLVNFSLIQSKLTLDTTKAGKEKQFTNRQMQGQSPYLINTGLYYNDDDNGWQINLLYNVVGSRIYAVGDRDNATQYEMSRHVLDLNLTKKLGKNFELKGGVSDLFNQPYKLIQDSNADKKISKVDETVVSYKLGRYVSVGFTYKF